MSVHPSSRSICVVLDKATGNIQCVCESRQCAQQFIMSHSRSEKLSFEEWAIWSEDAVK